MKKVYALVLYNDDGEEEFVWYCKTKKIRKQYYMANLMCDYQEHYDQWLKLHGLTSNWKIWKTYLRIVQPSDNYYFVDFKVKDYDAAIRACLIDKKLW